MKHSITFLLGLSLLFLTSCSKDSDKGGNNPGAGEFKIDNFFNGGIVSLRTAAALQPDGKLITGGNGFSRINTDGSNDNTFNPPAFLKKESLYITAIAVLSNGQILVAGQFENTTAPLVKLNSDGSQDNSFVPVTLGKPYINSQYALIYDILVQSGDKIVIAGDFLVYAGGNYRGDDLVRINKNGSWDNSLLPHNNSHGHYRKISQQADGKLYLSGEFNFAVNNQTYSELIRVDANGNLDPSFIFENNLTGSMGFSAVLFTALPLSTGDIIIGGTFAQYGTGSDAITLNHIARVSNIGKIDQGFHSPQFGNNTVTAIGSFADGRLLVGYQRDQSAYLLSKDGVKDENFSLGYDEGSVSQIIKAGDNSFFLIGSFKKGQNQYGVVRITKQ